MARVPVGVLGQPDPANAPRSLCYLLLLVGLAGCAEPFIVLPGGALSGEPTVAPEDWTPFAAIEIVQIETRPDAPYSVNVWFAALGPDVYVATGGGGTRWTEHLDADRRVKLRIDGKVYALNATRVDDRAERERIAAEYVRKYGLDTDDNWVEEGLAYRLDRR